MNAPQVDVDDDFYTSLRGLFCRRADCYRITCNNCLFDNNQEFLEVVLKEKDTPLSIPPIIPEEKDMFARFVQHSLCKKASSEGKCTICAECLYSGDNTIEFMKRTMT